MRFTSSVFVYLSSPLNCLSNGLKAIACKTFKTRGVLDARKRAALPIPPFPCIVTARVKAMLVTCGALQAQNSTDASLVNELGLFRTLQQRQAHRNKHTAYPCGECIPLSWKVDEWTVGNICVNHYVRRGLSKRHLISPQPWPGPQKDEADR